MQRMQVYKFSAKDGSSDTGSALVVIVAGNVPTANKLLSGLIKEMGRNDLKFELFSTEPLKAPQIVYSDMEAW